MQHRIFATALTTGLLLVGLGSTPAMADKPDWAGGGKPSKGHNGGGGNNNAQYYPESGDRDDRRHNADVTINLNFGDHQRSVARDYYHQEFSSGHCPPGLAKKHNGCMPPGQARKWSRGRPLPRDVAYYDVPHSLVVQLGVPPSGYRYVRVASDILLIATGTMMVMDAIEDLGR